MQLANGLIKKLKEVTDEKQIKEFLFQLLDILNVDYYLFALSFPYSMNKSDSLVITNYPGDWFKRYENKKLIEIDPVTSYVAKYNSPIFWDQFKDSEMEELKLIGKDYFPGGHMGFTIPLHGVSVGFGLFSLSLCPNDANSKKRLQKVLFTAQLLSPYLQDAARRVKQQKTANETKLTKRETECLTWATEGKSAWEISQILNCAERTVTFHLVNATLKLNCINRYQAIGKAIITGVITPRLL